MWDELDEKTLENLDLDLVLFVGDFGNENVRIVESIAKINSHPKAVLLGNHDAWM